MTSDPRDESDDEALSWGGDVDPTHVEAGVIAPKPARKPGRGRRPAMDATEPSIPASAAPLGDAGQKANDDDESDEDSDTGKPPLSSAALISFGILAGAYLLYTVGWIIGVQRSVYLQMAQLDAIALAVRNGLSVAAPALWYASTLWFTRRSSVPRRLLWLLLGALVLVPWPFVVGS